MHVLNGDVRLIAATNVCLDTLNLLQRRRTKRENRRANRIWEGLNLPVMALFLPLLAVLIVVVSFLRHIAIHGSQLTRVLIASAREFIADAEAVRLTQNPAALVSALERIEGRSGPRGRAGRHDDRRRAPGPAGNASDHRRSDRGDRRSHGLHGPDRPRAPRHARHRARPFAEGDALKFHAGPCGRNARSRGAG